MKVNYWAYLSIHVGYPLAEFFASAIMDVSKMDKIFVFKRKVLNQL
jgi:hypothetical protein